MAVGWRSGLQRPSEWQAIYEVGTEGLGAHSNISGKGHYGYWEEEVPVQLDLGISAGEL